MILVAPTAFTGTHTAAEVAAAIARGARAFAQLGIRELPVSDGGPGLIEALSHPRSNAIREIPVTGPLGLPVRARILSRDNAAIIESADACGLALVAVPQRSPWRTTTYGVGESIIAAAASSERVYVGLGGSATIDAGLGMAAALGWRLLDASGAPVERVGRALCQLAHIAGSPQSLPALTALADVHNPLTGTAGAAHVFGPQKGATPDDVARLDEALVRVAAIMQRDLGVDVMSLPGAGAAGGLGAGLVAFAGARIVAGSNWILDQLEFDRLLTRAHIVITGEGSFDAQSAMGKITGEVVARAGAHGVPVLLIAGRLLGELPPHVHAAGNRAALTLADIEQLVRAALPQLLAH